MKRYDLGLDVGGTNLAAGVVDEEGRVISHATLPAGAERGMEEIIDDMLRVSVMAVENAGLDVRDVTSWGVGMPSCINPKTDLLVHANCFGWRNLPIGHFLEKRLALPVYVENDANCAVLGEAIAGAAREFRNIVMLTLGTGVGSGIMMEGKIYKGADGMGAEMGHVKLLYKGRKCTCGQLGCIDAYCSARGLTDTARELLSDHSLLWELCRHDVRKLEASMVVRAVKEGDRNSVLIWETYLSQLAAAIGNVIVLFRPEVVILGGGVSKAGAVLLEPLRNMVEASTFAAGEIGIPELRLSETGDDAGIIGAASLEKHGPMSKMNEEN